MKLITKAIADRLVPAYQHSAETGEGSQAIVAKFFTPWGAATWYITEGMPLDGNGEPTTPDKAEDWHLFGFCDLGDPQYAELGYVLLSQLQGLKGPFGLTVERDMYYDGHQLAEVLKQYGRAA